MRYSVTINMRGTREVFSVDYAAGDDMHEAGFDALVGFPMDKISCVGYPTMHGRFLDMSLTGYRRYCGIVQVIERLDKFEDGHVERSLNFDVPERDDGQLIPYFAYGYPPEIYDAPCCNLRASESLEWRAYTYLVDMPTNRLSDFKLTFLGGYCWGYREDKNGATGILPLYALDEMKFLQQKEELERLNPSILW